ncbi:intraflagellar transport 57 [Willisornis vidua]|uniref:Intraflagellar transport protein 57 homolog n=1 Tax=Willisornis vidua TaxID=1566151 RepID=A0ABQ9DN09_9PASS|nr:intraflagellar transport 57 [Willisornis vidua]
MMAEEAAAGAGRRGERERQAEEGPAERGPGAAFHMFVLMEDLLDKLKLLSYEEEALRRHNMRPLCRPAYPTEELEEEEIIEDDAELTLNKLEEDVVEEESDSEENYIDLNVLKAQTHRSDMNDTAKQEEILQSTTDAAEWNLEVERVLPQLKVTVRTDNKDWRIHVDQMHQHKNGIDSSLKETRGYLDKLHNEISRTLEKINSREKYINSQLEHLVQEYRSAQALLSEITEVLEKVKQETEEKGSSMTDGAPLVKIKQALTKLKQETIQMDIQIGVMEHTLLQSKLKEKSDMTRDMHATMIPEATVGVY